MRIAFFGGSFDPPHRGHMAIAHEAIERLSLDRVLVAPAGAQPLKSGAHLSSFEDRLAMVRLAVQGDPRLAASAVDGPRPDGRPNYTLETLMELRRTLAGGDALFCLLGADAFFSLRQWHRSSELLLFCDFIVAGRPGFSLKEISPALPDGVEASDWLTQPRYIRAELAGTTGPGEERTGVAGKRSTLYLLPGIHEDVSATEIRAELAGGSASQTVLAPQVAAYIHAHGLYGLRASPEAPAR
jgi:nicotinate-nucleotide adenylyltransferase